MKFVVFTLGCKVNRYESGCLMRKLHEQGFEVSEEFGYADAYIINTCSVTAEADKKSRQAVARVLKYNPNAAVYIMGCSSEYDVMQFADKPNVRLICGSASKLKMLDMIIAGIAPMNLPPSLKAHQPKEYEPDVLPYGQKTRGMLKVQDGCNNFCSYCIIPYLRGRSRSKPIEDAVSEAKAMSQSTKEIVLTGIDLSSYGKDIGLTLTDLVKALSEVDCRKRISSLECEVVDENLLAAMRDSGFCDHFHLSMQSGSDSVLKAMNRHYDSAYYLQKVEMIRKFFPNAGIMTDIICGFPTETEQNHIESMATVEKAEFADAHIFPYSKREGTPAARLPQLPKSVKEERAAQMAEITAKSKQKFLQSQSGKVYPVYIEEEEDGLFVGYTPNYIKVYTECDKTKQVVDLTLGEIYKEGVKAHE